MTQPALSMQIRELEREIGAELVERRPNDVALTETGIEVAERAERILTAARDLVDFARHRDVLSGPLKLGIIPTLAPYVLPMVLPRLQRDYPDLRLELRETQTRLLLDELAGGELDCVMLALPAEGADVETLKLFDDRFLLAVPVAEPVTARGPLALDDVDQRRLILLEEGHCLRDQALALCATKRRDAPAGTSRGIRWCRRWMDSRTSRPAGRCRSPTALATTTPTTASPTRRTTGAAGTRPQAGSVRDLVRT